MSTPVIVNPTSGQGKARPIVREIKRKLSSLGLKPQIILTRKSGDAYEAAARAVDLGHETIVVAGGDGTINEVINGLCGASTRLGLIPLGTGNVLARDLKLPTDSIDEACKIIVSGTTRRIDLARAGDKYFALMAGFGFDASVVDHVVPQVKDLLGMAAYGFAAASALLKLQPSRFSLVMDGQVCEVDASMVIVANCGTYANNIRVAPWAEMDDGMLDVCVFATTSPGHLTLLRQAWNVVMSDHTNDRGIAFYRARKVSIAASPNVLVQIDGDTAGTTPLSIEVVPKCLHLIVP